MCTVLIISIVVIDCLLFACVIIVAPRQDEVEPDSMSESRKSKYLCAAIALAFVAIMCMILVLVYNDMDMCVG